MEVFNSALKNPVPPARKRTESKSEPPSQPYPERARDQPPESLASSKKKNSRRKHRNSHLGCGICKKRRIKCDENLPQCLNCVKGRLHCAYLNLDAPSRNALRMAQYNQNLRDDRLDDPSFKYAKDLAIASARDAQEVPPPPPPEAVPPPAAFPNPEIFPYPPAPKLVHPVYGQFVLQPGPAPIPYPMPQIVYQATDPMVQPPPPPPFGSPVVFIKNPEFDAPPMMPMPMPMRAPEEMNPQRLPQLPFSGPQLDASPSSLAISIATPSHAHTLRGNSVSSRKGEPMQLSTSPRAQAKALREGVKEEEAADYEAGDVEKVPLIKMLIS